MATTAVPPSAKPRRGGPLRPWLRGVAVGFLIVVIITVVRGTLGSNFHTVVPGRVYRSAQPTAPELEAMIREEGIRTVINLRGSCPPNEWYLDECRVTHKLNVAQEDIGLSAMRMPSTSEVRRLIEVLDHCEYPVLFHCWRGADRTGLASAIARLLDSDATLDEALGELGIWYGHVRIGKTAYIDRFFDLYADWLAEQGVSHSHGAFRHWATEAYCPGECRCALELPHPPAYVLCGRPIALALRARNTSIKPWRLRAETNAGIHAMFTLYGPHNNSIAEGRAGLFDAEVLPGESIDLTLALPAISHPGMYRLVVDMVDEQHCNFFSAGSDLLEWELEVREQEIASGR
jgi:protein tyrosine phosphatase (PTP) superfamily phosphohydrolase (DUF442 family)